MLIRPNIKSCCPNSFYLLGYEHSTSWSVPVGLGLLFRSAYYDRACATASRGSDWYFWSFDAITLSHIPLALPGQLLCNGGAINSVSNGCSFWSWKMKPSSWFHPSFPIFFINKWDPKSCRGWPLPPGLQLFCPCYSSTHMNARTQRFPTLHMSKAILFSFSGLIWLASVCICLFVQLFCAGKVSFILVCVEEISGASYLKEIL